ncbi:MAG: hypothetical protein HYY43_00275, partial [Deltaproteobacteria bacterium]|nr:hypothetical protein [Deltaproteobacteria bacterium]
IEPVRILWAGKGWYFVKTQQEYGWVSEIDLAIAKREDVDKLLNGTAVAKEFVFAKDLVRYGMGSRLPLADVNEESVTVEVPARGAKGILEWRKKELPKYYFDIEPAYTYAGVVKPLLSEISEGVWLLANKAYMGVEGVDCSGATKMALEIPGLLLGRNSGGAQSLAGKSLWERPKELVLEQQPDASKLDEAWNNNVTKLEEGKKQIMQVFKQWHDDMINGRKRGILLAGWQGHVMIFLGLDDSGRAIVISSVSRVSTVSESGAKPYEAKTDSQWLLIWAPQ